MLALRLNHPLKSRFWPEQPSVMRYILLVLAGTVFLALSAQLSIPFKPIPLTFQSAAVIMLGLTLGTALSGAAVITYVISGIAGLPVFANFGVGLPHLLGPTGGYIIGFLPAAIFSGYLAQKGWGNRFWTSFLAAVIGALTIFACGASYLASFVGWQKAFELGVAPFLLTESLKLLVVAAITSKAWKSVD